MAVSLCFKSSQVSLPPIAADSTEANRHLKIKYFCRFNSDLVCLYRTVHNNFDQMMLGGVFHDCRCHFKETSLKVHCATTSLKLCDASTLSSFTHNLSRTY